MIKRFFRSIWDYICRADIVLWLLLGAISVYSLLLLKSVSRATASNYFRVQLMAIGLGVAAAIVVSLMDYAQLAKYWLIFGVASIFLMMYTYLFGVVITGSGGVAARAWINIAGRTFQSSELVKIAFIVTYAKHLDIVQKNDRLKSPPQVVLLALHALIPMLLCEMQRDTGAAVVFFFIFLTMSLSAGIQLRYFAVLAVLIFIVVPVYWRYFMQSYQKDRIIALFNLEDEAIRMNEGYQQYQGRISIGSGKWSGQGLFSGPRVADNSVPFQHSDYIFSVAGEELGFVGCTAMIVLLLLFLAKILLVAHSSRDEMGKYICFGFFGLVAFQSVYNIGMCLAILPVMGITLPFFSAGGSSAMCLYLGFGLVQGVYMRRKESDGLRLSRSSPLRFSYQQMKKLLPGSQKQDGQNEIIP